MGYPRTEGGLPTAWTGAEAPRTAQRTQDDANPLVPAFDDDCFHSCLLSPGGPTEKHFNAEGAENADRRQASISYPRDIRYRLVCATSKRKPRNRASVDSGVCLSVLSAGLIGRRNGWSNSPSRGTAPLPDSCPSRPESGSSCARCLLVGDIGP